MTARDIRAGCQTRRGPSRNGRTHDRGALGRTRDPTQESSHVTTSPYGNTPAPLEIRGDAQPVSLAELTTGANRIHTTIETVIEGKSDVIRVALTVLLAEGHLLI